MCRSGEICHFSTNHIPASEIIPQISLASLTVERFEWLLADTIAKIYGVSGTVSLVLHLSAANP